MRQVALVREAQTCTNTDYDTMIQLFQAQVGSLGSGPQVFSDDGPDCSPRGSRIGGAGLAPGVYFLVVDGYAGASGNYNLVGRIDGN